MFFRQGEEVILVLLMQATDEDFSVNCSEIGLQCWWCLLVRGQLQVYVMTCLARVVQFCLGSVCVGASEYEMCRDRFQVGDLPRTVWFKGKKLKCQDCLDGRKKRRDSSFCSAELAACVALYISSPCVPVCRACLMANRNGGCQGLR